jgi:murein DD-endopeptidase MepM/ murein hydrolase activator NlpD
VEYVVFSPTGGISGYVAEGELTGIDPEDSSEVEVYGAQKDEVAGMSDSAQDGALDDKETVVPLSTLNQQPDKALPFANSNEYKITLKKGSTLASALGELCFDKADIHLLSKSLSKIYNLKNLKAGQEIRVLGKRNGDNVVILSGLEIRPTYKFKVVVTRTSSGFHAKKVDIPVKKVIRSVSGKIQPKSPAYSLKKCGVKTQISADALRSLAQLVDINGSKSPVDFEFLYCDFYDVDGNVVKNPELIYASALVEGKIRRVYRFSDGNSIEYVDQNGVVVKPLGGSKSMLQPPLSQMKINSRFGIRRHPISGQMRRHTGIDLSAKVGTPVRAAASGVIRRASFYAGYGRYVKIQHTGMVSTAYAHLSRIAVRNGQRVHQGQVIGYVGHSGYSSGPHLHYEVLINGSPINPTRFVKQEPQRLTGGKLVRFNKFKKEINLQVVGLTHHDKNKRSGSRKASNVY